MDFKNKVLLLKKEVTEGVDANPAGSQAIVTKNLSVNYFQGDKVQRNIDRAFMGAQEEVNANPYTVMSFDAEYASAGAAGTAPAIGVALEACGMEATVNAGVSVAYSLLGSAFASVSAYFARTTQLTKSFGVRGKFSIELNRNQYPELKFSDFTGSYEEPATAAVITPDTSAFEEAIPVTKDNTPTATIDGFAGCMTAFTLSCEQQITRRNAPNCESTRLNDREVKGSQTIIAPDLTAKNFFTTLKNGDLVPIVVHHGVVAGQIIELDIPKVQITDIQETEVDGEVAYQINWSAIPQAGDDEFTLTFK